MANGCLLTLTLWPKRTTPTCLHGASSRRIDPCDKTALQFNRAQPVVLSRTACLSRLLQRGAADSLLDCFHERWDGLCRSRGRVKITNKDKVSTAEALDPFADCCVSIQQSKVRASALHARRRRFACSGLQIDVRGTGQLRTCVALLRAGRDRSLGGCAFNGFTLGNCRLRDAPIGWTGRFRRRGIPDRIRNGLQRGLGPRRIPHLAGPSLLRHCDFLRRWRHTACVLHPSLNSLHNSAGEGNRPVPKSGGWRLNLLSRGNRSRRMVYGAFPACLPHRPRRSQCYGHTLAHVDTQAHGSVSCANTS
jgi:hypothetical protein